MDIRKFFGGGSSQEVDQSKVPKSALSEIKAKTSRATSSKKPTPSPKKRPEKQVVCIDISEEDSDESPLPSSLLKMDKKKKRVIVSSDSDDDMPAMSRQKEKSSKNFAKERSPAVVKKRSRVVRDSSSSPEKPPQKKKSKEVRKSAQKSPSPVKHRRVTRESSSPERPKSKKRREMRDEDEDEEMVEVTDSEDEFAEKKVKKKDALLKGQKTLSFTKAEKSQITVKEAPKKISGKNMDPNTFFGEGTSKDKKKEEGKRTEDKVSNSILEDRSNDMEKRRTPRKEREEKEKEEVENESKKERAEKDKRVSPRKESVEKKEKEEAKREEKKASPRKESLEVKSKKEKEEMKVLEVKGNTKQEQSEPKKPTQVFVPWVDKYRPKTLQQLVGQHGDKSPMNKLMAWLKGWKTWHLGEGAKVKRPKPPPYAETDGSPFKAVLLSGSPGIGKTTCAHLACELQGFKVVEMNASDVRNKKHLEAQVSQLTGCHQMEEYFGKKAEDAHDDTQVHHVLIMDEVDGMSGNEDRAGLSELIAIIKDTRIPIICICNDRAHPKMRTLVNYAYDVRFPKPRAEMLLSRVMTIASQEKLKITRDEALELIEQSGHDVRQTIYNLQMKSVGRNTGTHEKDYTVNTFEAARRLLGQSATLAERQQMFFTDYGIMPLFVQENYTKMVGTERSSAKRDNLACLRKAADLLAYGDTVEKAIRSGGAWKLLNEQSMLSAALPTLAMDGQIKSMIQFPSWLGRNSTSGKRMRLMRQLQHHAHLKVSASPSSLVMDYVPVLRNRLTRPLIDKEGEGVPDVISTIMEYDLVRDDLDAIAELAVWPGVKDPADRIAPKTKAALTRALNKTTRMLPYVLEDVVKGKKKKADTVEEVVDEFGNVVEMKKEEDELEEDEEGDEDTPLVTTNTKAGGSTRGGRGGARGRGRGRGK